MGTLPRLYKERGGGVIKRGNKKLRNELKRRRIEALQSHFFNDTFGYRSNRLPGSACPLIVFCLHLYSPSCLSKDYYTQGFGFLEGDGLDLISHAQVGIDKVSICSSQVEMSIQRPVDVSKHVCVCVCCLAVCKPGAYLFDPQGIEFPA